MCRMPELVVGHTPLNKMFARNVVCVSLMARCRSAALAAQQYPYPCMLCNSKCQDGLGCGSSVDALSEGGLE